MELNPIKAISAELERLVIEHGSAVIQEKHIALLKEQLALLSDKFSTLESEKDKIYTELQKLVTENTELKKKIQIYEDSNKPFFHANLLWLPNELNPYCPSCYGKNKNLVPMVIYNYQASELQTTKRFRCATFPECKFHTDIVPHPKKQK